MAPVKHCHQLSNVMLPRFVFPIPFFVIVMSLSFPFLSGRRRLCVQAFSVQAPRNHWLRWRRGCGLSSSATSTATTTTTRNKHGDNDNNHNNRNDKKLLFAQDLNIIYDSKCNVCKLEIDFLRRRDERLHGTQGRRLRFTDLEGVDDDNNNNGCYYNDKDPANGGIDYATGMKAMHAVTSHGRVLQGVPAFLRAYQAVGLGWLFTLFRYKPVAWLADRLYDVFAKVRTRLTRGATVDELVRVYEEKRKLQQTSLSSCESDTCQGKTMSPPSSLSSPSSSASSS